MDRVWSAYRELVGLSGVIINGRRYHAATPAQTPFPLEVDDLHRPVFVFNAVCIRDYT
jgi:hypothetical protein